MSYQESRALWRKLWRKEPSVRRAKLSYRARSLSAFLLAYSDDAGCLGSASKTGHRASGLARMIGIESTQRRAFYREADELLNHGDDGEPLALITRDGHLYLTRFEECQANRTTKADAPKPTATQPRPNQDPTKTQPKEAQSLADNPTESFNTETDLATEVRGKKIEDRITSSREAETSESQPSPPSPSSDPGGETWDAETLQRAIDGRRKALGHRRPIQWTGKHLEALAEITACAAERPHLVEHTLDAFFRDESQRQHGHLPGWLARKWDSYAESRGQQRLGRLASAQSYFAHRCAYLESQGKPAPDCAAWLPPDELDKFKAEYPGIDPALVRRSAAPIAKAKPEQRSGEPGNVADDLELAKCLANPEF